MGRRATSVIKERKRTTVYLMPELDKRIKRAYIKTLNDIGYQVDKTRFLDALLETGLRHSKDITKRLGHD